MTTPITAVRLDSDTKSRLEMLATQEGTDMSTVIRNLINEAAADFVTVTEIDTVPERDLFVNLYGRSSYTMLTVIPNERRALVTQEFRTNSWSRDEHHNIVKTCMIAGHPDEDDIKSYLVDGDGQTLLRAICDGHSIEWDGSNMVGKMTESAWDAWEELENEMEEGFGCKYLFFETDEWVDCDALDITAETTDAELREMSADITATAEAENVVLSSDVLKFLTSYRDELWDE